MQLESQRQLGCRELEQEVSHVTHSSGGSDGIPARPVTRTALQTIKKDIPSFIENGCLEFANDIKLKLHTFHDLKSRQGI